MQLLGLEAADFAYRDKQADKAALIIDRRLDAASKRLERALVTWEKIRALKVRPVFAQQVNIDRRGGPKFDSNLADGLDPDRFAEMARLGIGEY